MIRAEFLFSQGSEEINRVSVSGHAGFDSYGNDLVCASVSALIIATINGLEEYVGLDTKASVENGLTSFEVSAEDGVEKTQAQAIVHTFYLALCALEEEYGDFIEVTLT